MTAMQPADLLTASRLDVLGKLPFAESISAKCDSAWAREFYFECLLALNPNRLFSENGEKFQLSDYEHFFRKLMASLESDGFNSKVSEVLVTNSSTLWNGAHRLAGCLALNEEIHVRSVEETNQNYGWAFFENSGMHRVYLDELAWQFTQKVKSTRAIVLSGLPKEQEGLIRKRLEADNALIFAKTLDLSEVGSRRNIELMYGHLAWFSKELLEKLLLERFGTDIDKRVTVLLYDQPRNLDERKLKEELRSLLPGNAFERKIHGSDDWSETLRLAEVWTNSNSLRFLNSAPIGCEDVILGKLRDEIGSQKASNANFVIDGGASLELYGVTETSDVDHVCLTKHPEHLVAIGDCHNSEYLEIGVSSSELILDPRKHMRWAGFKFSSLESEFLRLRLLGTEKSYQQLITLLSSLEAQSGKLFFDSDRSARAAKWQRKSLWQIRLDNFLAKLPPGARRFLAKVASSVRLWQMNR